MVASKKPTIGQRHGMARWLEAGKGEIPKLINYLSSARRGSIGMKGGLKPLSMYDDEINEYKKLVRECTKELTRDEDIEAIDKWIGIPEKWVDSNYKPETIKDGRKACREAIKRLTGGNRAAVESFAKSIAALYNGKKKAEKSRSAGNKTSKVHQTDDYRDREWMEAFKDELDSWYVRIVEHINKSGDTSWLTNSQRPDTKGISRKKKGEAKK